MTCSDITKTTMTGEWRINPRVLRAKGDRSVRARVLPVGDNAFTFYNVACLRKKLVSYPDDLLFVERICYSMALILHAWKSGKFGDERKAIPISYNSIRMVLFVSLKDADEI